MNINNYRAFFQDKSIQLENLLKEYKKQYPKSLGALVRNFFPVFLIILAVLLPITSFYAFASMSIGLLLASIILPFVLLVFAIVLYMKNKKEKKTDPDLLAKINSAKAEIEPFAQYSDVKNYLDQYNNQITETDKTKKQFRRKFRLLLVGFFVVFLLVFVAYPYYVINHHTSGNQKNESLSGLLEVLGIEENKPFIRLAPLKKEIYNNCRITNDTVDFYYSDIAETKLHLGRIELENDAEGDIFRLFITDKDGVPVPGCGRFVFKAVPGLSYAYNEESTPFCLERQYLQYDTIPSKIVGNDFCALRTAQYLLKNQNKLFFVVERIQ